MLLPSFFIIGSEQTEELPIVELPTNGYLIYKMPTGDDAIGTFYKQLFLQKKTGPFALCIDLTDPLFQSDTKFEKLIESLVSFTFHHKYLKRNYDNPLIIFESTNTDSSQYISMTPKIFKGHGYNNVEVIIFEKSGLQNKEQGYACFDIGSGIAKFPSQYLTILENIASNKFSFFFFINTIGIIPELIAEIQKSEEVLRKEFPRIYDLLQEAGSFTAMQQELQYKTGLLEEQLSSLNSYYLINQSDSIYKKQVTELLDFYKYEYEILPLWYKQFGHILKVLMGKRTFKSLFSDNVKKYKK